MMNRRSDARQNRDRLLEAAEEVFLELGADAPLNDVAERAGVSRITLFRNFPNREALLLALLDRGVCEVEQEVARMMEKSDPLGELLRYMALRMLNRAPLVECWRRLDQTSPELQSSLNRVKALFENPIRRAVMQGRCREDLCGNDILLLLSLFSGSSFGGDKSERQAMAERAMIFGESMVRAGTQQSEPMS